MPSEFGQCPYCTTGCNITSEPRPLPLLILSSPQYQARDYSTLGRKMLAVTSKSISSAWSPARASNKLLTATTIKYLHQLCPLKSRLKESTGYLPFVSTAVLMDRLKAPWTTPPAPHGLCSQLHLPALLCSCCSCGSCPPLHWANPASSNHRKIHLLCSWGSFLWLPKWSVGCWYRH